MSIAVVNPDKRILRRTVDRFSQVSVKSGNPVCARQKTGFPLLFHLRIDETCGKKAGISVFCTTVQNCVKEGEFVILNLFETIALVLEIGMSEVPENEVEARRFAQAYSVALGARRIVVDGKDWDVRYEWYIDNIEIDRYRFKQLDARSGQFIDLAWSITDAFRYLSAESEERVDMIPMEIVLAHSER